MEDGGPGQPLALVSTIVALKEFKPGVGPASTLTLPIQEMLVRGQMWKQNYARDHFVLTKVIEAL
jgi:hypothetical protein